MIVIGCSRYLHFLVLCVGFGAQSIILCFFIAFIFIYAQHRILFTCIWWVRWESFFLVMYFSITAKYLFYFCPVKTRSDSCWWLSNNNDNLPLTIFFFSACFFLFVRNGITRKRKQLFFTFSRKWGNVGFVCCVWWRCAISFFFRDIVPRTVPYREKINMSGGERLCVFYFVICKCVDTKSFVFVGTPPEGGATFNKELTVSCTGRETNKARCLVLL